MRPVAWLRAMRLPRWTPRLSTIFFTFNALILLLPLGGIVLLRLYESVLIRRAETELVMQGAHVAAVYLHEVQRELSRSPARESTREPYGIPVPRSFRRGKAIFHPLEPRLDLAVDPILGPPEEARPTPEVADPVARAAGDSISPALRLAQRVTLAGIRVVDFRGIVVATTRTELTLSLAHREEVRRALAGENVSLMRQRVSDEPSPPLDSISRGTQLRVFVAMPVIHEDRVWGAVVLSRTPQAVGQSLFNIRWYILGGALVLLALLALLSVVTSRTVTRPVAELIQLTERVARGEKGVVSPLENPGTLEMRRVSEAIARMARALEERAEYIDAFARGVSHEFKTPLASMRGTIELLRDHLDEMTDEERERFLANLEQDTERLTRLVTRLTDLARADVIKPRQDVCELGPVVAAVSERFRCAGLDLTLDHDEQARAVRIAREPLEAVLTNLLDNAHQHGGPDVKVTLRTRSCRHDADQPPYIELQVRDDGPGISEANRKRVFDHFFTTARNRGGSGLGLSIVQKLVEAHGGTTRLESEPGRTVFTVTLPATPEG
jgi:signal transduction histidine kinase